VAALACAEDVVLIAPAVKAMRVLLDIICDDFAFASEYDIVFNVVKSECLIMKTRLAVEMLCSRAYRQQGLRRN